MLNETTNGFRDAHWFLSNHSMSPVTITWKEKDYLLSTGEHVFQGMKVAASTMSDADTEAWLAKLAASNDPAEAKRMGRSIRIDLSKWNAMSYRCMERTIALKFTQNPDLLEKLVATEDMWLIEYNNWKDTLWGVDETTLQGKNQLGVVLMEYRNSIKAEDVKEDNPDYSYVTFLKKKRSENTDSINRKKSSLVRKKL
jgi:ribA/ribD-fused uncharacterized protein